jgi:hypothetical protein
MQILVEKPEERDDLRILGISGRVILSWILRREVVRVLNRFT